MNNKFYNYKIRGVTLEEAFKVSIRGLSGISLLTFFLGILIGHWLNIQRDKRNRLFELSKEIKPYFIEQSKNPLAKIENNLISKLDAYIHYMSGINYFYKKKSQKLDMLKEYFFNYLDTAELKKTAEPDSGNNELLFIDLYSLDQPEPVKNRAIKILRYLND